MGDLTTKICYFLYQIDYLNGKFTDQTEVQIKFKN